MKSDSFWQAAKLAQIEVKNEIINPTVLAFSAYFHDSSACIVKNGKIIAAAEEERFTRKKHDNEFPSHAINYCLEEAKTNKVDAVVFFEDPTEKWTRIKHTLKKKPPIYSTYTKIKNELLTKKSRHKIQEKFEDEIKLTNKIIFLNHHLSHAASSYLVSGFDEAALLTIDGTGENVTTTLGYGNKNNIELSKCIKFPHSIGLMYTAITAFLGFEANSDEYKVMGLAAYGDNKKCENIFYKKLQELISIKDDGSYALNMDYFNHDGFEANAFSEDIIDLFNIPPRKKDSKITREYKDLACALQMITEDIVIKIINYLYEEFPSENLCYAGGVALNSVLNGKILRHTPFKKIFIQPAAGDSGTVIGAAKYVQHLLAPLTPKELWIHSYYGPQFTDCQIQEYLDKNKIQYFKFKSRNELLSTTAQLLLDNNVIGWFQGRMEWGPRALGNRSILASPKLNKMKTILNAKVKHRELFRPFAPAVCVEDAATYFDCDIPIPAPTDYMLMVYPIKQSKQKLIPAVTHADGTGRLQTIRQLQNPLYYDLIKEFGKISGVPILVNTSFNIRGEPIVCTPSDAYNCMMKTEIDYLVANSFLIKRADNREILQEKI